MHGSMSAPGCDPPGRLDLWSGFNTSGMRNNFSATFGGGWIAPASAYTRTRTVWSNSEGSRLRTVAGAGRAGRQHSTSLASRISARRPGEAASGLVANRSRNGSREPWRASTWFFANAGIATSGRSARGLDGSAKAGSTTSPSRVRAGSCAPFAAGCNACGCGRYACGPRVTTLTGSGWSPRPKSLGRVSPFATPGRTNGSPSNTRCRSRMDFRPRPVPCGGCAAMRTPTATAGVLTLAWTAGESPAERKV